MLQFQFHERIAQLVYTFPEDATTSTGSLFWSAPKRFPQPLTFNSADPSHVAFAQAGAILKAQVHNIDLPAWATDNAKVWAAQLACQHKSICGIMIIVVIIIIIIILSVSTEWVPCMCPWPTLATDNAKVQPAQFACVHKRMW